MAGEGPTLTISQAGAQVETTRTREFSISGTSGSALSSVTTRQNGGNSVRLEIDGTNFSTNQPFELVDGRNEFEITAVDLFAGESTTWFAVRFEANPLADSTNGLLAMFPLGMRPR